MEPDKKKALLYQPLQKKNTLSFTADQVITDDTENNLQMGVFKLQT
jgi:hypothetical protein